MTQRRPPAWHTTVYRHTATPDQPDTVGVEVEVRVSDRRRKYSTAYWEGDTIVVVLPSRLPPARHRAVVDDLVARLLSRRPHAAASDEDLARRARQLGERYLDGVRPGSIRWVTNQNTRWGSCSPASRHIRISHRLRAVPGWVLDAVVVHELAHLLVAEHGPRFQALIQRYPRMADADLYLAGFGLGLSLGDGGAPDGAMPDGAMPDGTMPDGTMPDGAMPDGAMPDGAMPDGAMPDGAMPDGAMPDPPDGAVPDGSCGTVPGDGTAGGRSAPPAAPGRLF